MTEEEHDREATMNSPENWVDLYGDALFRYAYSRTLNKPLAEDLVQETFLAALVSRESFRGASSLKTWLVSILKNKIIDYYRKAGREAPASNQSDAADPTVDLFDKNGKWKTEPENWQPQPENDLESKEFWGVLQQCLDSAPPRLAHAFSLRELNGLSAEEISNLLGVSQSNCWVILHRARMTMKKCLIKSWFTG